MFVNVFLTLNLSISRMMILCLQIIPTFLHHSSHFKLKFKIQIIKPKFNTNIKFKLNLKWLKYVNIKKLNNNRMKRIKTPTHNTPKIPLSKHVMKKVI